MKQRPLTEYIKPMSNSQDYLSYLDNLADRRFVTGYYVLDQVIRGVAPGEVLTIIAYSGTFKSAFLQNLLSRGCRRNGLYHLFFSQEMPFEKCFERQMQLVGKCGGFQVEENFRDNHVFFMEKLKEQQQDKLLVIDQPRLSIDRVRNFFYLVEAKYGAVAALGIDYLGLMESDGRNLFEKTAELTFGIKTLAKQINRPIILLCQTNRAYAASKGLEIEADAGKGGGDVEAGADFLLGMYFHDNDLICRLLKNRNGPGNVYFKVDIHYPSLTFVDLSRWEPPKKEGRIK